MDVNIQWLKKCLLFATVFKNMRHRRIRI